MESATAHLPPTVMSFMIEEANHHDPHETGGVLMGYWQDGSPCIVSAVGPGPKAVHSQYGFRPDQQYHESEMAQNLPMRKATPRVSR